MDPIARLPMELFMQQHSMLHFCDACGSANAEDAMVCTNCQQPLGLLQKALPVSPSIAPVNLPLAPVQHVIAGAPLRSGSSNVETLLAGRYRIIQAVGHVP